MSARYLRVELGLLCDKCGAEWTVPEKFGEMGVRGAVIAYSPQGVEALTIAAEAGWTRWVNRGARHYCPTCTPTSASMRQTRLTFGGGGDVRAEDSADCPVVGGQGAPGRGG